MRGSWQIGAAGCLIALVVWFALAWFMGWLASSALGAFGVDAPVWACVIVIFILGSIFGGSAKS